MHSTTGHHAPPGVSLRSNRAFLLLWGGQAISHMGDALFTFTLILWIATTLTHLALWAPLAVSGVVIADALPLLLIAPFAGVFVDRWDKRRTMLWMDLLRALFIVFLLLMTRAVPLPFWPGDALSPLTQIWLVYGVIFATSSCSQFFTPAKLVLTSDIVAQPLLTQASSMEQVTQSLALICGPVLAAPLLFSVGIGGALLINALSFLISWLAIVLVNAPSGLHGVMPGEPNQFGREFAQGLRFSLKHPVIRGLIIGLFIAMFGIGAYNTLYILFFLQNLHTPAPLVGLLDGVFGIGVIIGAVMAGTCFRYLSLERLLGIAGIIGGIAIALLARMTNSLTASGLLLMVGICQGVLAVTFGPLILKVTPRELVGRVMSILNPITVLASLLATPLAGYLAGSLLLGWHASLFGQAFGPLDTILLGAGLMILLAGIYLFQSLSKAAHTGVETTISSDEPVRMEERV
jgi:MFS family permease